MSQGVRQTGKQLPEALAGLFVGGGYALTWLAVAAALFAVKPYAYYAHLPDFLAPSPVIAAGAALAIVSYGGAATLMWPRRKLWPNALAPSGIAPAVFASLCQLACFYARQPAVAFVAAALALAACCATACFARGLNRAAAACLVPCLAILGYAAAALYAVAMLNP